METFDYWMEVPSLSTELQQMMVQLEREAWASMASAATVSAAVSIPQLTADAAVPSARVCQASKGPPSREEAGAWGPAAVALVGLLPLHTPMMHATCPDSCSPWRAGPDPPTPVHRTFHRGRSRHRWRMVARRPGAAAAADRAEEGPWSTSRFSMCTVRHKKRPESKFLGNTTKTIWHKIFPTLSAVSNATERYELPHGIGYERTPAWHFEVWHFHVDCT